MSQPPWQQARSSIAPACKGQHGMGIADCMRCRLRGDKQQTKSSQRNVCSMPAAQKGDKFFRQPGQEVSKVAAPGRMLRRGCAGRRHPYWGPGAPRTACCRPALQTAAIMPAVSLLLIRSASQRFLPSSRLARAQLQGWLHCCSHKCLRGAKMTAVGQHDEVISTWRTGTT